MQYFVTPFYENIFKEPRPEINDIIANIPSPIIIEYLAFINSQLYLMEDSENQLNLLDFFIKEQSSKYRSEIIQNYTAFKNETEGAKIIIFSRLYTISFIHHELLNFRDFNYDYITSADKLNIFKAYCIIASVKSSESQENSSMFANINNNDFFIAFTWPILLNQLDSALIIRPEFSLIRGICLLNYFQFHTEYSKYVEAFLNKTGTKNAQEYIITLLNILRNSWESNEKGVFAYSLTCDDKLKSFFSGLTVNPREYCDFYRDKKEDNIGLKSWPLFYHKKKFMVLDWGLISNKIYEGLIFDFFNNSGIKKLPNLDSIPKLKEIIGHEVTEKIIFRRLISSFLTKKHCPLIFPTNDQNGEPDAYFREGRNIILFEIKDAFFPNTAINSGSYKSIKKAINEKYNSTKKGTGQLIKQIKNLQYKSFESKDYSDLKIKVKNIKVFPVIIYTDKHFGMPGVSNYLIEEFNVKLDRENIKIPFKKVYNLTFLNLEFFYQHMKYIKENNFIKLLERIHHNIKVRKTKHNKFTNVDNLTAYNMNMETIFMESNKIHSIPKHDIRADLKLFDLNEGLAQNS